MAVNSRDRRCSVPKCRDQDAEHVLVDCTGEPFRFCWGCAPAYHAAGYRREGEDSGRFNYRRQTP